MSVVPIAAWEDALDEYERVLEQQERVVAAGVGPELSAAGGAAAELATFSPPPGLGPLPESLRPRAEALARRTNALVARVRGLMDHASIDQPPRRRLRSRVAASSFDLKA